MTYYEIGGTQKVKIAASEKVGIFNSGNPYVGFRAFALNEKTGAWHEVFETAQESLWVDGTNQGAWSRSTHETRESAFALAWKAYRKMAD